MSKPQSFMQAVGLDEAHNDFYESLPSAVKPRVDHLKELQKQLNEIEKDHKKAIAEIEAKFRAQYVPILKSRAKVISGEEEVDGVEAGAQPAGIPDFWVTALKNNTYIEDSFTQQDFEVLKSLKDIEVDELTEDDEYGGFRLLFHFSPNDYFTNATLTKTYVMEDDDGLLEDCKGCEIDWKAGKNVVTSQKAKPTKKSPKPQSQSFFKFFSPPDMTNTEGISQSKAAKLQEVLEDDFELGCMIRDMVGNAVEWYLGIVALEFDDDDEDDEDDEDDDEDDDDDDDDDDDEEDEDDGLTPEERKKKEEEQCKQQ